LAELVRRAHGIPPSLRTERILHPLRRFVIGTGTRSHLLDTGYVLSHPKLGVFVREEYFRDELPIKLTRLAFIRWGLDAAANVNLSSAEPRSVSPYLLQHLTLHFQDINVSPTEAVSLVEEGWPRAWQALEGGYRGFSQDVHRVDAVITASRTQQMSLRGADGSVAGSSLAPLGVLAPGYHRVCWSKLFKVPLCQPVKRYIGSPSVRCRSRTGFDRPCPAPSRGAARGGPASRDRRSRYGEARRDFSRPRPALAADIAGRSSARRGRHTKRRAPGHGAV